MIVAIVRYCADNQGGESDYLGDSRARFVGFPARLLVSL